MAFEIKAFTDHVEKHVKGMLDPIDKRVAALEAQQPEPVDIDAIVKRVTEQLSSVAKNALADNAESHEQAIGQMVQQEVKEYLEHNPPAPGKDGADGIGVAGALLNKAGHCLITATDGQVHDIGKVEGRDGVDGVGFDDADLQYDNGQVTLSFVKGDRKKSVSFDVPDRKHIGYWQAGLEAKAGDSVTHNGSMWVAMRKTTEQPTYKSNDWCLAARQGSSA